VDSRLLVLDGATEIVEIFIFKLGISMNESLQAEAAEAIPVAVEVVLFGVGGLI
jgi:hypothetical protein